MCPNCGITTSLHAIFIESEKAFLPGVSNKNNSMFTKAVIPAITNDDSPHYISFGVFECQGCHDLFVANKQKYQNSWTPIYPIPHKPISEDIPEPIKSNFEEANLCFAVCAYRASSAMCQIALEAIWHNLGMPDLNTLEKEGIISAGLRQRANEIRLWGNIIKHEAIVDPVTKEDCEELIEYLNVILDTVYVEPKRFERFQAKRKLIENPKNNK